MICGSHPDVLDVARSEVHKERISRNGQRFFFSKKIAPQARVCNSKMRFLKGFLHLSTQIFACGAMDLFQIINGTICTMIHSLTQSTSWDLFTMHWIQYIGLDSPTRPTETRPDVTPGTRWSAVFRC